MGRGSAGQAEGGPQIDRDQSVKGLVRGVADRRRMGNPGIVVEDVQAAEGVDGLADDELRGLVGADVLAKDLDGGMAEVQGGSGTIHCQDLRPLRGEQFGGGAADAAGGACDNGPAAGQSSHGSFLRCFVPSKQGGGRLEMAPLGKGMLGTKKGPRRQGGGRDAGRSWKCLSSADPEPRDVGRLGGLFRVRNREVS